MEIERPMRRGDWSRRFFSEIAEYGGEIPLFLR
jgi:hypothetical protein